MQLHEAEFDIPVDLDAPDVFRRLGSNPVLAAADGNIPIRFVVTEWMPAARSIGRRSHCEVGFLSKLPTGSYSHPESIFRFRRRLYENQQELNAVLLVPTGIGFTTGYDDRISALLAADGTGILRTEDRAVLTLVLIHSVAIPRTEGTLAGDAWVDGTPTPVEELQRRTQLPRGKLRQSLGRLRAAGLVRVVPARLRPGNGAHGTAYLPGPQFHRLTEAARRRLQEELILAAGPDTPLAAAIRRRRSHENSTHEKEHS